MLLCLDVMTMINGDGVVMACFVHYYKTVRRGNSGSYSLEVITLHVLVFCDPLLHDQSLLCIFHV